MCIYDMMKDWNVLLYAEYLMQCLLIYSTASHT
jgi:hypothetical protein